MKRTNDLHFRSETAKTAALLNATATEKDFSKRAFMIISMLVLAAWFATG